MEDESTFLFVRNYAPLACRSARELEAKLAIELEPLVGESLDEIWLVWDIEEDEWFCDAPVILGIAGRQLEVTANKLDELYVSLDLIDRDLPLGWPDDECFDLEWRRNPSIVPDGLLGRRIRRFGAGEYAFELSEFVGTPPWILVSLECELDGDHLAIDNALDENSLRFEPPDECDDFRVRWF